MSFNYDLIDASRIGKFKCIQMKDSSVYFGEVAWMDENGTIYVSFLSFFSFSFKIIALGRTSCRPSDQP